MIGTTLVVLALALLVSGALKRRTLGAVESRIPGIPELTGMPDSLKQAVLRADRAARSQPWSESHGVGQLGRLYHANHLLDNAGQCYVLAIELAPENPLWAYLLADVRQTKNVHEGLEDLLKRTIELAPDYAPAVLRLADLDFKEGRLDQAEAGYRRCLDLAPRHAYGYLGLARAAIRREQWEKARDLLETNIKHNPRFGAAHRLLGTVHGHFGDPVSKKKATFLAGLCNTYVQAPDKWVDDLVNVCYVPGLLSGHASVADRRGDEDGEIAILKRAVRLNPDDSGIAELLAERLIDRKKDSEARALLVRAVEKDPYNERARSRLAFIAYEEGRLDAARREAEAILEFAPSSCGAYKVLGAVWSKRGDQARAAGLFAKAYEMSNFTDVQAVWNYVSVQMQAGRPDAAITFLKDTALKYRPESAGFLGILAQVYRSQGKRTKVADALREAMKHEPFNANVARDLAALLVRTPGLSESGKSEAIRMARIAVDFAEWYDIPKYKALDTLALAYLRAGHRREAAATGQRAAESAKAAGDQTFMPSVFKKRR